MAPESFANLQLAIEIFLVAKLRCSYAAMGSIDAADDKIRQRRLQNVQRDRSADYLLQKSMVRIPWINKLPTLSWAYLEMGLA